MEEEYIEDNYEQENISPIRDTEAVIERAKDFFNRSLSNLVLDNLEIDWKDLNEKVITIDFPDFFKHCQKKYEQRKYQEVAKNTYGIIKNLYRELKTIKKELEADFRDLVREVDNMDQYLQNYETDIENLNAEIIRKNSEITDLKEQLRQIEVKNINQRIDTMHMMLMGIASGKGIPHEYFDDKVLQNVAEVNNIPKQELQNHFVDSDKKVEEVKEEEITESENKEPKKVRLQKCHEQILEYLKEEELYPIHKINPTEASSYYRNVWENLYFQYDLQEADLPEFIDFLEYYKDKPDEYLDVLAQIEEIKL